MSTFKHLPINYSSALGLFNVAVAPAVGCISLNMCSYKRHTVLSNLRHPTCCKSQCKTSNLTCFKMFLAIILKYYNINTTFT